MSVAELAEERSGFDLKNLVTILLIGLAFLGLIASLLSTVSGPINDPARAQCMNNQHEIWTAVQVYESRKRRYPGWRTTLAGRQVGWPVQLMPYLGINDLYNAWATEGSKPKTPGFSVFACPNDEQETEDGPWLSYIVNCGLPDAMTSDDLVETKACGLFFDNVVTDPNSKPIFTSASEVMKKDGNAQTLGLGENLRALDWTGYSPATQTVQEYLVGFNWQHYADPPAEPWLHHPVNQRDEEGELITTTATNSNAARLNGPHGKVVIVTFADGHSVFLSDKIDERVYNKLCTPDGSSPIREDWPVQEPLEVEEYLR